MSDGFHSVAVPFGAAKRLEASERLTDVRVRKAHKMCRCGGEFISTGQGYSNNAGSFYWHKCNKCGEAGELCGSWPQLVYESEREETD